MIPQSWGDALPVRPSSLPKLKECACYIGKPGTSPAAERGTMIDGVIRHAIATGDAAYRNKLVKDDVDAVAWAVDQVEMLAMGHKVYTEDADCKAELDGARIQSGTMDGVCPDLCWLVDYKTGQIRNYKEQMAAYALACMDTYFADEWTCHVLFVDQRHKETYRFTHAEAEECINTPLDQPYTPNPCDYCTWCGRFDACPALQSKAEDALALVPSVPTGKDEIKELVTSLVETLLDDPDKAAEFIGKAAIIEDIKERVRDYYKEDMASKGETKRGRFGLSVTAGRKSAPPDWVGHHIQAFGFGAVLNAYGPLPEAKARELWAKTYPDKEFPADALQQGAGFTTLRISKQKTTKN